MVFMNANPFAGSQLRASTAPHIRHVVDRLKVAGVEARSIPADMIDNMPRGDRSIKKPKRPKMQSYFFVVSGDVPVSIIPFRACPFPAPGRRYEDAGDDFIRE
jgi:hypothetical protein